LTAYSEPMAPIPVFLDSSIIRSSGRAQDLLTRTLQQMVRRAKISLHVSVLVEREVASGVAADAKRVPRETLRAVEWFPATERTAAQEALSQLEACLVQADRLVASGVAQWLDELGVARHEIDANAAHEVFDAYFAGRLPFTRRKNRDDIPDAFIAASIRAFAARSAEPVHIVTGDHALGRAFAETPNVVSHENWRAFFADPAIAHHHREAELRTLCEAHAPGLVARLNEALRAQLVGTTVESPDLPSDDQDGTIAEIGDVREPEFRFDEADVVDDEPTVIVPFTTEIADCTIDLFVHKSNWGSLDENRFSVSDGDWNERYMLAELCGDLSVCGSVAVAFESEPSGRVKLRQVEVLDLDQVEIISPRRA
jgi:hypothetical protein